MAAVARMAPTRAKRFMEILPGSEPHVARMGDVDIDQGVQQPHPLTPQLQKLVFPRLPLEQLRHLQLPVHPSDPILETLSEPRGAAVEDAGLRVVLAERALERLGALHGLLDLTGSQA